MNDSSGLKVSKIKGKAGLHPRSAHHGRYQFKTLIKAVPELAKHIVKTPKGEQSIDFSNPQSVMLLNKALLAHHYDVSEWSIPKGYLCPPIPGRADYIHRLADLLERDAGSMPKLVKALDVGVGANCIYPIIANRCYNWQVVGADIDQTSVKNANRIVANNPLLSGNIECRHQPQSRYFFSNIIKPNERYHVTTCNPPFHKSAQEAAQGTQRKVTNLSKGKNKPQSKPTKSAPLNFGGQSNELWCPGGEAAFVKNMAFESRDFKQQVLWFSTLLSKKDNVRWLRKQLEKAGAIEMKVVEMSQGQKVSRFVAWTFMTANERQQWLKQV